MDFPIAVNENERARLFLLRSGKSSCPGWTRFLSGAKELLQLGSAIDREFTYDLIQKAAELSERELLSRLSVLKDTELIYERGDLPGVQLYLQACPDPGSCL